MMSKLAPTSDVFASACRLSQPTHALSSICRPARLLDERRRHPRVVAMRAAEVRFGKQLSACVVLNVSRGGVLLELHTQLAVQKDDVITLHLGDAAYEARVARCAVLRERLCIGCELLPCSPELAHKLEALIGELSARGLRREP